MYLKQQNITYTSIYIYKKRVTIPVFKNQFIDELNDFSIQKKKNKHNAWKNFLVQIDHIDHMVNIYLLCFIHCISFKIQNISAHVLSINKHRT